MENEEECAYRKSDLLHRENESNLWDLENATGYRMYNAVQRLCTTTKITSGSDNIPEKHDRTYDIELLRRGVYFIIFFVGFWPFRPRGRSSGVRGVVVVVVVTRVQWKRGTPCRLVGTCVCVGVGPPLCRDYDNKRFDRYTGRAGRDQGLSFRRIRFEEPARGAPAVYAFITIFS